MCSGWVPQSHRPHGCTGVPTGVNQQTPPLLFTESNYSQANCQESQQILEVLYFVPFFKSCYR